MLGMKVMLALAATGLAVAIGGILYGVVTVGVPYPDPTPAQAAAERANLAIVEWAMVGGGLLLLCGVVGMTIRVAGRLLWPAEGSSQEDALAGR
jgi:hypothetical protein